MLFKFSQHLLLGFMDYILELGLYVGQLFLEGIAFCLDSQPFGDEVLVDTVLDEVQV